jgi:hypothetical protein
MMKSNNVAMYIDHIRVYQTSNHSAHVGLPHSLGCDPVEYPTKEFIMGHEHVYMRSSPFVDKGSLVKQIKKGGGLCKSHADCGGISSDNNNAQTSSSTTDDKVIMGHGKCVKGDFSEGLFGGVIQSSRCMCNEGYVGPMCLSIDKKNEFLGAYELNSNLKLFRDLPSPTIPIQLAATISTLLIMMFIVALRKVNSDYKQIHNVETFRKVQSRQRQQ